MIDKFEFEILDTLIDDFEPFAVIYKEMVLARDLNKLTPLELADALKTLSDEKLIICTKSWDSTDTENGKEYRFYSLPFSKEELVNKYETHLHKVNIEEIQYDEVGYYFALTLEGYEEWAYYLKAVDGRMVSEKDLWRIIDRQNKHMRIIAKNEKIAKDVFQNWKEENREKTVDEASIRINKTKFRPKYYSPKISGIVLSFSYVDV